MNDQKPTTASDTPMTDAEAHGITYAEYESDAPFVSADFASTLERELAKVTAERDEARTQLAAARSDTELMEWTQKNVDAVLRYPHGWIVAKIGEEGVKIPKIVFRAAIDSAKEAK